MSESDPADALAPWPWPPVDAAPDVIEFDAAALVQVRALIARWDIAETGAAGLTTPALDEIDDDDALGPLVDLFLTTASLPRDSGTIRNPYGSVLTDPAEIEDCLAALPDPSVATLLRAGDDIAFAPTADERTLWQNATFGATGIDPKRPFGSGNVGRDIRALVDPDKALKQAAFTRYRKTLESRLVLFLQFFVQTAELPFASYTRDGARWVPSDSLRRDGPERIDVCEWEDRLTRTWYYQTRDYHEILTALLRLIEDGRLAKPYRALVATFRLDDFYTRALHREYDAPTREMLQAGRRHFPEPPGKIATAGFTLREVRILNSAARFEDARTLLDEMAFLTAFDQGVKDRRAVTVEQLFFLESLLARVGTGHLCEAAFLDLLQGRNAGGVDVAPTQLYGLARHWTHLATYPEGMSYDTAAHMQALSAQILVMAQVMMQASQATD